MRKKTAKPDARELLDEIKAGLEVIEEYMAWQIRADQRFKVGQRVEFSKSADRKYISQGRKGGVRTGKITKINGSYGIVVHLDGHKKPSGYHHALFNPVKGPKMF